MKDGFPPPSLLGQALRRNYAKGGREGNDMGRRWVPAFARTGEGLGSRIREDEGREMGPRIREDERGGMGSHVCEDKGRGMGPRIRRPLRNYRNAFRQRCGTTLIIAKSWDSGFRLSPE